MKIRHHLRGGVVAALVVLVATSACSAATPNSTSSSSASLAGATLTASEFKAALQAPGTVLLDVRTAAEFSSGHLPGARNLDVEATGFADAVAALDPAATYAVYCRSGRRSLSAMSVMQSKGITKVYDLGGGISAWTSAGGDVVTG